MFIAVKLAKAGYYGGDPLQVLNAPADMVQSILEFETFESEYVKEDEALNKKPPGK